MDQGNEFTNFIFPAVCFGVVFFLSIIIIYTVFLDLSSRSNQFLVFFSRYTIIILSIALVFRLGWTLSVLLRVHDINIMVLSIYIFVCFSSVNSFLISV